MLFVTGLVALLVLAQAGSAAHVALLLYGHLRRLRADLLEGRVRYLDVSAVAHVLLHHYRSSPSR